jgi:hypothetical protein
MSAVLPTSSRDAERLLDKAIDFEATRAVVGASLLKLAVPNATSPTHLTVIVHVCFWLQLRFVAAGVTLRGFQLESGRLTPGLSAAAHDVELPFTVFGRDAQFDVSAFIRWLAAGGSQGHLARSLRAASVPRADIDRLFPALFDAKSVLTALLVAVRVLPPQLHLLADALRALWHATLTLDNLVVVFTQAVLSDEYRVLLAESHKCTQLLVETTFRVPLRAAAALQAAAASAPADATLLKAMFATPAPSSPVTAISSPRATAAPTPARTWPAPSADEVAAATLSQFGLAQQSDVRAAAADSPPSQAAPVAQPTTATLDPLKLFVDAAAEFYNELLEAALLAAPSPTVSFVGAVAAALPPPITHSVSWKGEGAMPAGRSRADSIEHSRARSRSRNRSPPAPSSTRSPSRDRTSGASARSRARSPPANDTIKCNNCGGIGHIARNCASRVGLQAKAKPPSASKDTLKDRKVEKYVLLAPAREPAPAPLPTRLSLSAALCSTAPKPGSQRTHTVATFDTLAQVSAISSALFARLPSALRSQLRPPRPTESLAGATGAALVTTGSLARIYVVVEQHVLQLNDVFVVPELQWHALVGLPDLLRAGGFAVAVEPDTNAVSLRISDSPWFAVHVPSSTSASLLVAGLALSTATAVAAAASSEAGSSDAARPADESEARRRTPSRAALPRAAPDAPTRRSLDEATDIALAADATMRAAQINDSIGARPIPASYAAIPPQPIEPEIAWDSPAEIAYRREFQAKHKKAWKQVQVSPDLPHNVQRAIWSMLGEHKELFAAKAPDGSTDFPPVMNCAAEGIYPLQLSHKAGVDAKSGARPKYESKKDKSRLAVEADRFLRSGRAFPAHEVFAVAPGFVVKDKVKDGSASAPGAADAPTPLPRIVFAHNAANEMLLGSAHNMPNAEQSLEDIAAFGGNRFLQSDVFSAFHQWSLAHGSGAAVAITLDGQVLTPCVAQLGIKNVPAGYHHMMAKAFELDRPGYLTRLWMDDLIGNAKDADARNMPNLLKMVAEWLAECRRCGVTCSAPKTRIGFTKAVFVGHELSKGQIRAKTTYLEALRNYEKPATFGAMRRFLGVCVWVRRFLVGSADDIAVLVEAQTAAGPAPTGAIDWSPEVLRAWNAIIAALSTPNALAAFNAAKTLFIFTDASGRAGACIYMQLDDAGKELCIVNAVSFKFTAAQLAYTTQEKELAALRNGVEAYPHYTVGRTSVWRSDNAAILDLMSSAEMTTKRRLLTTALDLVGHSLHCVYINGVFNELADALSRAFSDDLPDVDELAPLAVATRTRLVAATHKIGGVVLHESTFSADATSHATPHVYRSFDVAAELDRIADRARASADQQSAHMFRIGALAHRGVAAAAPAGHSPELGLLSRVARAAPNVLPLLAAAQILDDSLAIYRTAADKGTSIDGFTFVWHSGHGDERLLFARRPLPSSARARRRQRRNRGRALQAVVPSGLRMAVLEAAHLLTGCTGLVNFARTVRDTFFWPGQLRDIDRFSDGCDACLRSKRARVAANFGNPEAARNPSRPAQFWQIDEYSLPLLGLDVVGAICEWSGYTQLFELNDKSADDAAAAIFSLRNAHGEMDGFVCDGGPEFKGMFKQTCESLSIATFPSTPYNADSHARIERAFRSLNDNIAAQLAHAGPIDRRVLLAQAQATLNNMRSARQLDGHGACRRSSAFTADRSC